MSNKLWFRQICPPWHGTNFHSHPPESVCWINEDLDTSFFRRYKAATLHPDNQPQDAIPEHQLVVPQDIFKDEHDRDCPIGYFKAPYYIPFYYWYRMNLRDGDWNWQQEPLFVPADYPDQPSCGYLEFLGKGMQAKSKHEFLIKWLKNPDNEGLRTNWGVVSKWHPKKATPKERARCEKYMGLWNSACQHHGGGEEITLRAPSYAPDPMDKAKEQVWRWDQSRYRAEWDDGDAQNELYSSPMLLLQVGVPVGHKQGNRHGKLVINHEAGINALDYRRHKWLKYAAGSCNHKYIVTNVGKGHERHPIISLRFVRTGPGTYKWADLGYPRDERERRAALQNIGNNYRRREFTRMRNQLNDWLAGTFTLKSIGLSQETMGKYDYMKKVHVSKKHDSGHVACAGRYELASGAEFKESKDMPIDRMILRWRNSLADFIEETHQYSPTSARFIKDLYVRNYHDVSGRTIPSYFGVHCQASTCPTSHEYHPSRKAYEHPQWLDHKMQSTVNDLRNPQFEDSDLQVKANEGHAMRRSFVYLENEWGTRILVGAAEEPKKLIRPYAMKKIPEVPHCFIPDTVGQVRFRVKKVEPHRSLGKGDLPACHIREWKGAPAVFSYDVPYAVVRRTKPRLPDWILVRTYPQWVERVEGNETRNFRCPGGVDQFLRKHVLFGQLHKHPEIHTVPIMSAAYAVLPVPESMLHASSIKIYNLLKDRADQLYARCRRSTKYTYIPYWWHNLTKIYWWSKSFGLMDRFNKDFPLHDQQNFYIRHLMRNKVKNNGLAFRPWQGNSRLLTLRNIHETHGYLQPQPTSKRKKN